MYGGTSEKDNGNGSLMRMLPVVLFNYFCRRDEPDAKKLERVYRASQLTHAHGRSLVACGIYAFVAEALLNVPARSSVLAGMKKAAAFYQDHAAFSHFARLFSGDFPDLPVRSSGYVVDTLEAALWCLLNTDSYKGCVLKAVNLGGDADTIAAIAGGLAGILYGEAALPKVWLAQLAEYRMIDGLCKKAAEAWG